MMCRIEERKGAGGRKELKEKRGPGEEDQGHATALGLYLEQNK